MRIMTITDTHIGMNPKKIKVFRNRFIKYLYKHKIDGLIIAGDIALTKQSEIELFFKTIRDVDPFLDVFVVFGNHDFWDADKEYNTIKDVEDFHIEVCKKYNIHYLQENRFENDEVIIMGFDGWYQASNPSTNDMNWMTKQGYAELTPFQYLKKKEIDGIGYILDRLDNNSTKTIIIVTHFNPIIMNYAYADMSGNLRVPELMCDKIDYLIFGHTHQSFEQVIDRCTLLNVGADYNHSPNLKINKFFKILEI